MPPMVLPFILLRAVHVGPPTCMRWRGVGTKFCHSFFSPGPGKSGEVMILYYNTEGHIGHGMVSWLPQGSHEGGERQCRMKSFRFGGVSLFDLVAALVPRGCRGTIYVPAMNVVRTLFCYHVDLACHVSPVTAC
jgi:hypothetical protein